VIAPSLMRGSKVWDLRFKDPDAEAAFKKSLEPELLRWTLLGMSSATLYTIFHEAYFTGPAAFTQDQDEHLQDIRYYVFLVQLTLWTLIPVILCTLVALRVFAGMCSRWNWEIVINSMLMYGVIVLVIGQTAFMTRLSGEDPDVVWREAFSCSVEAWVLMSLDVVITISAFLFPIRTVLLWTVPCTGISVYTMAETAVHQEDISTFPLKFMAILALSILAWSGALRNERHLRTEWVALQQVSMAEDRIEMQQSSIDAKGQEILEKDAQIQETTHLVRSLQTVMTAVCETMVLLTADLKLSNTTASHDLFFERPVEGELFTNLLSNGDGVRLQEALSQVSDRHLPACLAVTLHRKTTHCEVTLLIADRGPQSGELRYLVGIRMDKENHAMRKNSGVSDKGTTEKNSGVPHGQEQDDRQQTGSTTAGERQDLPNHMPYDSDADDEAGESSGSCDEGDEGYARPPPTPPPPLPRLQQGGSSGSHQQEPAGDEESDNYQPIVPDPYRSPSYDPNRTSSFPLPSISEDSEVDCESIDNSPGHVRATYPLNKRKKKDLMRKETSAQQQTHVRSRARTIRMVMKRWKVRYDMTSCCHFHTAARSMDEAVEHMMSQPCDAKWECLPTQCPRCTCMNSSMSCLVCGMENK